MAKSTVQLNLPPALVTKGSPSRESRVPAEDTELSLTALLADSVASTGCSEKEAAIAQGYEPAYWSRVKSGEKAAHLERISGLPLSVQRAFVMAYAKHLNLRVTDEDTTKRVVMELARAAVNALEQIA